MARWSHQTASPCNFTLRCSRARVEMDPAEQLRSVTAHRDALLAEVKTLQRDKHHLRRDVETLRRDLAATSSARDAAVLELSLIHI